MTLAHARVGSPGAWLDVGRALTCQGVSDEMTA